MHRLRVRKVTRDIIDSGKAAAGERGEGQISGEREEQIEHRWILGVFDRGYATEHGCSIKSLAQCVTLNASKKL